ncbi:MAG: CPBP family intramembrane glutamic endopeptidase [Rhodospirillales bacterium]
MTDADTPLLPTTPSALPVPPTPERPDRWDILRFVLFFILSLVLSGLILVALAAVTWQGAAPQRMDDLTVEQHSWLILGVTAMLYISVIASVWLAMMRRGRNIARALAFNPVRWTTLALGAVGLIVLSIIVSVLGSQLMQDVQPRMNEMFQGMTFSPPIIVMALFLIGVMAPIAEEMFFRGLLFGWLRAHWPFWLVAIVTAALFGLAHGNLGYAVVAGALGLMLAYLRERSGSLWTSIVAHIANNVFAIGMAMLAPSLV